MTVEELARMLREIEVKEMEDTPLEHESYEDLPIELQTMYMKLAEAYQKHFHMERKHDT